MMHKNVLKQAGKRTDMKKAVTIFAAVLVFLFIGLFVFRCCMSSDRSVFSKPVMTDALSSAFADGESVIYTHRQTSEISPDGYFSAYKMYYNPESREVQFAVRWNDSVYDYTDSPEGMEFSFSIINETTGEEYPCEVIESKKVAFYNYRRLIAENVSLESNEQLTAIMKINDSYESRMVIKYDGQPFKEYKKAPQSIG